MNNKGREFFDRSEVHLEGYALLFEPQFEVSGWAPGQIGDDLPMTQVHFLVHWPPDPAFNGVPPIAIRFKDPDAIKQMIQELIRYRRMVWPESEKIGGDE